MTKKDNSGEAALVRELAEILTQTDLTEIELEREDIRLRVARTAPPAPTVFAAAGPPAPAPVAAVSAPAPETPAPTSSASPSDHPGAVKSPMVGTAYRSPSPGAKSFVEVGDKVKEGQTLLIVEAMKTMNPITATHGGTVSQIFVNDAQPVEFGETLLILS
ncbi:MAG: acetyl-CoA carboxylase biotin carboxyl carrier protein [Pseudomonadota bacterium]